MAFPAYLFDYNGVLVDDERVHLAAYQDVLEPMGVTMTEEAYWESYLGFDDRGAFRAVLQDQGRPADDALLDSLVAAKAPAYLRRAETGLRGFDGAAALLRRLSSGGARIAIVSGALRAEIELGLGLLGVRDVVDFIVAAEDAPACKPDPMGYQLGFEQMRCRLGVLSERDCLVLEDSVAGIEAGHRAHLGCLGVAHTYSVEALMATGACGVAPRIADISDGMLEELFRKVHG